MRLGESEQERCHRVAAGAGAVAGLKRRELELADRLLALEHGVLAQDDSAAEPHVVLSRSPGQREVELGGVVDLAQRDPVRGPQPRVPVELQRYESRGDVVSLDVAVGDAELTGQRLAVVDRQRQQVDLEVAAADLCDERRAEHAGVVHLHAVRPGDVRARPGSAAAGAAGVDAVGDRAGRRRVDVYVVPGVPQEHLVVAIEAMVDAQVCRHGVLRAVGHAAVVGRQARAGGLRVQLDQRPGNWRHPARRDPIAGEGQTGQRVVDLHGKLGEVADAHRHRRHRDHVRHTRRVSVVFEVREEERPIRGNRAADTAARLVLLQRGPGRSEEVR